MKRSNKILSMALALLMVIPMFAFAPLEANAASAEGHKTFSNLLDFEDAAEGVLTADYVQSKLARGFSATTSASGVAHSVLREVGNWTVAEEQKVTAQTAGADTTDTSDDVFTYEAVTTDAKLKNYVLRQTTPGRFPEFTLWDTTGVLFAQPFEFAFDIFPRGEQVSRGTTGGDNTGLISFCNGEAYANGTRANLLTMSNGDPTNIKTGSYGAKLGTLTLNQWTSIRIRVYPAEGRVIVWINGKQVNDSVLSGLTNLYNAGAHTKAAIAIGWNYSQTFDFDLDNISLCSIADTPDINEHIDFTDARIDAVAATPETTTTQTLAEYLSANSGTLTSGISQFTDSAGTECFGLVQDGDNWVMRQDVASTATASAAAHTGLTFKDTTNLTNQDTVTITFDFRRNADGMPQGYNTVRTSGGTTMGPLTFREGKYITTNANGYATFRKTDEGYVQGTIAKDVWYSFKVELDMPNTKMKVWVREGTADGPSTGDWEPVYYLTNGTADGVAGGTLVGASTAVQNTYTLADYESIMTTDADLKWYNGSSAAFGATPQLWFLHGTGNAWGNGANADMDNLTIKTADGGVDVSFDFTPEIVTIPGTPELPANTDWWDNDTFQNANSKKASAKLTDFQVVDAPAEASTYGKVIQPKATLGAFCFNDTKNLLPSYVFDVSFDLYITQKPTGNIHLLKLWTPAEFSTVVLTDNNLYAYDQLSGYTDNRRPLNYSISDKTWHNFRVRFNLLDGTYTLYVNGRLLCVQDITQVYKTALDPKSFENIHFEVHNHYASTVKAYHFLDNIRVETVEEAVRNAEEFVDYEILAADFEDSDWLDKVEAGEIDNLSMSYSKASILSDAGVAGNSALLLTGTVGGAMDVDMMAMGGYHNTFSVEMAVSYGNPHGSALDLAVLSDNNLSAEKTLLSVMGDHAQEELTGTFFFNDDGNRYYLCDYTGKYYHSDNGDAEATTFTDIGIVVDAESNSYAVYINQKPAYYKAHGEADTLTRASNIPLGMVSGKTTLKSPMLSILSCSSDKLTTNKLLVDDISVASIKNGMTPMLVGYQENTVSGTSIRFLATVDTLYYEEMGFIVEAKGVTQTISTTTVFTSVTANGSEVVAKELDGRYITALVVSGIDESPVEFTVTPYAIYFGKEIRGESQVITYTE